jgi:hypothetical protein
MKQNIVYDIRNFNDKNETGARGIAIAECTFKKLIKYSNYIIHQGDIVKSYFNMETEKCDE